MELMIDVYNIKQHFLDYLAWVFIIELLVVICALVVTEVNFPDLCRSCSDRISVRPTSTVFQVTEDKHESNFQMTESFPSCNVPTCNV